MFQSFTGNARRQRQVNLSSRSSANPFATHQLGGRHAPGPGSQATLALAQQERLQRQQERERLNAGRTLQRIWRGHRSRKQIRSIWRNAWDAAEQDRNPDIQSISHAKIEVSHISAYRSADECISQLRTLLHFLEYNNIQDAARMAYFAKCFQKTLEEVPAISTESEWTLLLSRFVEATLRFLSSSISSSFSDNLFIYFLQLLAFLPKLIPKQMTRQARGYYSVMATLTLRLKTDLPTSVRDSIVQSALALVQVITSDTLDAYEWFARIYLTIPSLEVYLGTIDDLALGINYKLLASSIDFHILRSFDVFVLQPKYLDSRLWLLAYFIYFHRHALGDPESMKRAPEPLFVKVIAGILGSAASEVARRLNIDEDEDSNNTQRELTALPPFIRGELTSLINQHSITHLLSQVSSDRTATTKNGNIDQDDTSEDAKSLAAYALTLLRVFPRRGDEIRMWLYLGSTSSFEDSTSRTRVPALKYFWQASKLTRVFNNVVRDSRDVLPTLLPPKSTTTPGASLHERDQEWTIILIFLELYTFLLKVLDDEEFFSAGPSLEIRGSTSNSWTQESALPLGDVKSLTLFLKNLAFTLYWNAADLAPSEVHSEPSGLGSYFSTSSTPNERLVNEISMKAKSRTLGGVTGIPLDYFKGLVTGLLRMIHQREYV